MNSGIDEKNKSDRAFLPCIYMFPSPRKLIIHASIHQNRFKKTHTKIVCMKKYSLYPTANFPRGHDGAVVRWARGEEGHKRIVLEGNEAKRRHLVRRTADAAGGPRAVDGKVLRPELSHIVPTEAGHPTPVEQEACVLIARRHRGDVVVGIPHRDVVQVGKVAERRALVHLAADAEPEIERTYQAEDDREKKEKNKKN